MDVAQTIRGMIWPGQYQDSRRRFDQPRFGSSTYFLDGLLKPPTPMGMSPKMTWQGDTFQRTVLK